MIAVQKIIERMDSFLDAEGSDRYTFERDYKAAINSSVEWLQSVFNRAFADKKLTEENLRDLIKVKVYQTSKYSRVNLNLSGDSIWSIMKVTPEPSLNISSPALFPYSSDDESFFRPGISYTGSGKPCKKLSMEQWEEKEDNIFEAGNNKLLNSFKSYAYLNFADYSSTTYSSIQEIEIRPSIAEEFVAVSYLKYPTPVKLETDSVEFPESLTNLVYQKALNFVSYKQGDQTNLYSVTDKDVNSIVRLML